MKTARIYQRPKNAMSSGKGRTHQWVVEYESHDAQAADPLTGWAGGADTQSQVRMSFPDREAAIAYAEREGIQYHVVPTPTKTLKLQSYADNFR